MEEQNFPRGGTIEHGKSRPNNRHMVFDQAVKSKKRSKKKPEIHHLSVTGPQPKLMALEDLSYKIMTEGMLVLGYVKDIHEHFIDVILPGLTEGKVPVTNISDPYTQLLQSSVEDTNNDEELHPPCDMFFKGQLVTCQISKILQSDFGKYDVSLSLNPRALHSEWSHISMAHKGLIITAAVQSIEEHGYVMDCGVNALRCFLKLSEAKTYCDVFQAGQPLVVGQLVRCLITEAESTPSASKIMVTADPRAVAKQEGAACLTVSVQQLMPGMCYDLAVVQELKGGVRAKIINLEGIEGFVHSNHLPLKISGQDNSDVDVALGSKFLGRLLYITPLVKTPYFSLLPSVTKAITEIPKATPAEEKLPLGTIVKNTEVLQVSSKGISIRIQKHKCHAKGFIPLRRSGFNFKRAEEERSKSTLELVRNDFPIGTSVKCRVLHYDCLSDVFICSMEKHVLEEKYLTLSDISVGDVVSCIVQGIRDGGIIVQVGMLTGFVPASHSADIPLKHPEQKFQPGTEVKGRVMKIDLNKHRMIVTLKPSLISCKSIITSYTEPLKGHCYLGTVVGLTPKGTFVSFFGGVRGFLPYGSSTTPEGLKFFEGQVLKCYVIKCDEQRIKLSLFPHPKSKSDSKSSLEDQNESEKPLDEHDRIEVGHEYTVEVVSVAAVGLGVRIISEDCRNGNGIIPSLHLSDDVRLCPLLCETYEIGSRLENVWCYRRATDEWPAIFSLRSSAAKFFKGVHGKVLKKRSMEAVSEGWIIPCTVEEIYSEHVLLQAPLPQFSGLVRVDKEFICNDKNDTVDKLGLVKGQGIQAKILSVNHKEKSLSLGCCLKHVWDGEVESCAEHLLEYLKDQNRLHLHAKKTNNPLGSYSIGAKVCGIVKEKTPWGFIIELEEGVRGETTNYNAISRNNIEVGTELSAWVLYVDCLRKHVELTLLPSVAPYLKNVFDSDIPKIEPPQRLHGPALLVTPEFILAQVKWVGKRPLAYIPTQLYPYMSSPLSIAEPYFGLERKLICKRVWNKFVVCVPMEIVMDKKKQDKKEAKRLEKLEKWDKKIKDEPFGENGIKIIAPDDIKKEKEDSDSDSSNNSSSKMDTQNSDEDEPSIVPPQTPSKRKKSVELSEAYTPLKKIKGNNTKTDSDGEITEQDEEMQPIEIASTSKGKHRVITLDEDNKLDENEIQCLDVEERQETKKKRKRDDKQISERQSSSHLSNKASSFGKKCDNQSSNQVDKSRDKLSSDGSIKTNSDLKLKTPGFVWNVDPKTFLEAITADQEEPSSDDEDEILDDQNTLRKQRKKSVAERKEIAKVEEERLQKIERDLMDPNRQPTSCDDFDKMLLADPNNSAIWLQYMAFHMQATEIEKARVVGQRAIKTINYREEQEKLNVWLGLLNLENLYGTPSSLSSTLHEALQYNDPYKVRVHMIRLYAESGKCHELDNEVKFVTKKFKDTPGMWLEVISILMTNGQAERARKILDLSLPFLKNKQDSTSLVVQFALLEARHNNLERAKTLLESLLASYPQRVDVWCTYCDLLVKANHIDEARQLLERCVHLKLQARKMKTLFAKYLKFEEMHGTPEGQERVRKLAVEFVNQVTGGSE